ncbi:MAG TPA: crosslink repair DNA glycosylase YcaQ family protein, partial [Terriglobales bacterium]
MLRRIGRRDIHVTTVDSRQPSPFAATLLFSYVANYIYEGDAPLAERRAQALSIDQAQLRELLGDADFRELLDAEALEETESQLQALDAKYRARNIDGLHDLLRRLGDLTRDEIVSRSAVPQLDDALARLEQARRALILPIGGEKRYIAAEDASRYRDALGVPLPQGLPEAFTQPVANPVLELVRRYARSHGPFTTQDVAARFGLSGNAVEAALKKLLADGKVLEGEFRPGGVHREWCDAEVLRTIRRKSLARLRREVEPVEQQVFARMLTHWQGLLHPRSGLDALLDAIENLQGAALPASIVETEILPARVREYSPADLDTLIAAGEVVWCGVEPLGERDGRIALFLADHLAQLWRLREPRTLELADRERKIVEVLAAKGALFFSAIHEAAGGGYPGETQ